VTFTPDSTGKKSGTLVIGANGVDPPSREVGLSGSGLFWAVEVLSPNGGEVWETGFQKTIEWDAPPQAVKFRVSYSVDDQKTWRSAKEGYIIGTSTTSPVPLLPKNAKRCFIKVTAYDKDDKKIGTDKSDGPFTIEVIRLTYPNGGETLTSGDEVTVKWTTHAPIRPVETVQLFYTLDGGGTWKQMKGSPVPGNPQSFLWEVPTLSKDKNKCKVRVVLRDREGKSVGSDGSDSFFKIEP